MEDVFALFQSIPYWPVPGQVEKEGLTQAAKRVVKAGEILSKIEGSVIGLPAKEIEQILDFSLSEWTLAQAKCVESVLDRADKGLWPFLLWPMRNIEARVVESSCPNCSLVPMICRFYESTPGVYRQSWECKRCDIVMDHPLRSGCPRINIKFAADRIAPKETIAVAVVLDHRDGTTDLIGAGALVMTRTGHQVTCDPSVFPLHLQKGEYSTIKINLVSDGPATPHIYRLVALLLLNGQWFWASTHLVVVAD